MSKKLDPAQGGGPARPTPKKAPTPKPKSAAQVKAQVQPALNAQARKFAEPKGGGQRQDFRRG